MELVAAEAAYKKAKRALEDAKETRDELLERLLAKFQLGRWVNIAGWAIKVTMQRSGDRFSLSAFLQAGHKPTAQMRPFISAGGEHPRLWIEPIRVRTDQSKPGRDG